MEDGFEIAGRFNALRFSKRKNRVSCIARELSVLGIILNSDGLNIESYSEFLQDLTTKILSQSDQDLLNVLKQMTTQDQDFYAVETIGRTAIELVISNSYQRIKRIEPGNGQTMIAYVERTIELDGILSKLTRNFCATECGRGNTGCCTWDYHNMCPPEILNLQEMEARIHGWTNGKPNACKYHASDGCKISIWKPPICIGHLCGELRVWLDDNYLPEDAANFFTAMMRTDTGVAYASLKLEKEATIYSLDVAIRAGNRLVAEK